MKRAANLRLLGTLVISIVTPQALGQVVLYVDQQAQGNGDGLSWNNACTSLQGALTAAEAMDGQAVEIWVAQGTYLPGTDGDRTASFHLRNQVAIYGGFVGIESQRGQRDFLQYPTVLSGDLNGDDEPIDSRSLADNSYHVLTAHQVDASAILDGFVISAGNANGSNYPDNSGAGLLCVDANPNVVNCEFSYNVASYAGGAMFNSNCQSLVANCLFQDNRAGQRGGAVYNTFQSNLTLQACSFYGNVAGSGGALHNSQCDPVLVNCLLIGNSATAGGAMFNNGGSPQLINCTFSTNIAGYFGGGVYGGSSSMPTIVNNIFWNNYDSGGTSQAAQIYSAGQQPVIHYSCVQGWNGTWGGQGNIGSEPGFVDVVGEDQMAGTADDDLRLAADSPCIDAGDSSGLPSEITLDYPGRPRFVDDASTADSGPAGMQTAVVDMGAYEYQADGATGGPELVAAVSRVGHGSLGAFDVDILAGDTEPRKDGSEQIVLTFDKPIAAIDGTFDAGGELVLSMGRIDAISADGETISVDVSGLPDHTCVQITIDGLCLAGNVGQISPTRILNLALLCGDVDNDGSVTMEDYQSAKRSSGQPAASNTFRSDIHTDGYTNMLDIFQVRKTIGNTDSCQ